MNKAAKRYLREVRSLLPVARKAKTEQTAGLRASLEAYISENPNADYVALCEVFGKPDEFAASCVENTPTAELLRKLRFRQLVIRVVAAIAAVVLITWFATVAWAIRDVKAGKTGYREVVVQSDEGEVVSYQLYEKKPIE